MVESVKGDRGPIYILLYIGGKLLHSPISVIGCVPTVKSSLNRILIGTLVGLAISMTWVTDCEPSIGLEAGTVVEDAGCSLTCNAFGTAAWNDKPVMGTIPRFIAEMTTVAMVGCGGFLANTNVRRRLFLSYTFTGGTAPG